MACFADSAKRKPTSQAQGTNRKYELAYNIQNQGYVLCKERRGMYIIPVSWYPSG